MSEDTNQGGGQDKASNSDGETAIEQTAGREQETGHYSETAWEELPSDPKSDSDLGYDRVAWERFKTLDGTDQVMFLPEDDELLREDAFVVADDDSLVDLANRR